MCKPRPKVQRTPTEAEDDHPASSTHLPPSPPGNHLLHTRSNNQASSSSPGSASTTLPHTPATPTFPAAPKATIRDEIHSSNGLQQHHHRGRVTSTAGYTPTYLETGSNHQLDGAAFGGPGIQCSATLSEEFLALRTNDPFASPPPGTAILPRVPSSPSVRRKKSVACVSNGTADLTATSKSRRRPNTASSDEVLSDGWKGSEEGLLPELNAGGGPSSKKARTVGAGVDVYGAHASSNAKLSKRSSQKPTFSRRPSNKRRRSGGFSKSNKETPAKTTSDVVSPFGDGPSLVPGTTRPRPPRSPVSHPARHVEEPNSLGLVVYDHQSMSGAPTTSQDASQATLSAPHALSAANHDEWLLKTVLTNALAIKQHQEAQYLDPATAGQPRDAGLQADYGVDGVGASEERDRRSGSATPTAKTREDAGPTPRGGSPTVEANVPTVLPQERRKDFKFTTIVDSSVSTGPGSPFPHSMIYQHPTLDGPARLPEPNVALFESFPRTPSLADTSMSIASLPSASELQHQTTPSPDQHRTPFMLTNDPPSSFEASAPIDIPATRTTARNHHRRRAPSASILEAARAMPLLFPPTGPPLTGDGGGRKLHKPNSSSYDAARARARALMTEVEATAHRQPTGASQGHDNGTKVNNNMRIWLTRVPGGPAPTNGATGGDLQALPTSIGSPGLPLPQSRFSDPTTAGTDSSGDRTNSTGGADAGSESSFK
ncbi:hypothetical protein FS837_002623 [Tulasnella sp. UAMH 9824]|nr:hypothetical protein FS837_002623 [Tulasnella sp. UAMH 9824]